MMDIADNVDGARASRGEDRDDRSSRPDRPRQAESDYEPAAAPPRLEVLESLWSRFGEFRAYAEELVRIEKDRAKLSVREAFARFRNEALVFFALCTLVVTGSIYTLTGLSAGISDLFGAQPWVGELSIGVVALVGAASWMRLREARKSKRELDRKIGEYEQRHEEQRARFGRHVSDRNAQPPAPPAADGARAPRSTGDAGAPRDGDVSRRSSS